MGPDFPSNSHRAKEKKEEKKVERVVTGKAVRRKKPLGKQFKETFVGGDFRSSIRGVVMDTLIPLTRDMMYEAFTDGMHRLIFGGDTRRRSSSYRPGGPLGHIDYSSVSRGHRHDRPPEPRTMSRRGRSRHDFGEIVLSSRAEAVDVIDAMFELASKYDVVSVADLYELVGLESTHADYNWGWDNLEGADVMTVRGGYLLDLPDPTPFK